VVGLLGELTTFAAGWFAIDVVEEVTRRQEARRQESY
jgi:hypothetical protein